jgi:3-methylcrotonyl-CoA carboxylase alpha subunit
VRKLLIANRGEIACRIARTAHRIGIRTVAVFGQPDRDAPHVVQCDEAIDLGGETAAETYLDIGKLIDAAARTGCDALHPGYGFLSESPDLVEAAVAAGLAYAGPSAEAMRRLGSKAAARQLAVDHGIPVVPGYDGADQERLEAEAARIGPPLLIKASAGGGGRGMRVVRNMADLPELLQAAAGEALAAFGDGTLILERQVERPRHVEVQVLADSHGSVIHLGERDCTLQRRHQKVIEEAPAAFLQAETRAALGAAAVRLVREASYTNAATVEFLVAPDGSWYLIEVNTRLQVEHPVTELVTGLDLVEWQLRIARGERLAMGQEQVQIRGHAVELRICAEDPDQGLRPTSGTIRNVALPPDMRVDHALADGMVVGAHFDSLLAKLIVHGRDRSAALRRARAALACTRIDGVATNMRLLDRVLADQEFVDGGIDTNWLEGALSTLVQQPAPGTEDLVVGAIARLLTRPVDGRDPWLSSREPWRLNLPAEETVSFVAGDVRVRHLHDGFDVEAAGSTLRLRAAWTSTPDLLAVEIDGHRRHRLVRVDSAGVTLLDRQIHLAMSHVADRQTEQDGGPVLRAPLPGKIIAVPARLGDQVVKGDVLVILEAMKMEHRLSASIGGRVTALMVAQGDRVLAGDVLAELAP